MPPPIAATTRLARAALLLDQGQPEQARLLLMEVLRKPGAGAEANRLMRNAMKRLGDLPAALYYAQRAAAAEPENPASSSLVGLSLLDLGRLAEAVAPLRHAIERDRSQPRLIGALGHALAVSGELAESERVCREGLAHHPLDASIGGVLATALIHTGRVEEARDLLASVVAAHPNDLALASLLCTTHVFLPARPEDALAAHRAYGRILNALAPSLPPIISTDRDPGRPLRVGLVSFDLRDHAASFFIRPVLENAAASRHSFFVYSTSPGEDRATASLRSSSLPWKSVARLAPTELARIARSDQLDIAIDLVGHYVGSALPAFQCRVAPVQATWIGYPSTSGVRAMDWRIVDSLTDPAGTEKYNSEKIFRLDPCFVCYKPPENLPPVSTPPCAAADAPGITFGCFSGMPKYNDPMLRVWAKIMDAAPDSRLLIKNTGLKSAESRVAFLDRCIRCGLRADRLIIEGPAANAAELLPHYNRIDITLDTFPCTGMTSTCESLVMGVPAVALMGVSSAARGNASHLAAVGMSDLACTSEDQYVRAAADLAANRPRLAALRTDLRPRLLASTLCDAAAFMPRFEHVLETMWAEHCSG